MDADKIIDKFGSKLIVNDDTFRMGINIKLTDHLAKRFTNKVVLETCTGGGFSTISLAKYSKHVYTFEIDKSRLEDAKENCKRLEIDHKVTFFNTSVFDVFSMDIIREINTAFIDPDWNNLNENYIFRFHKSMTIPPSDEIFNKVMSITKNISLIQPPFIEKKEFESIEDHEFERLYLNNELALYCLHFGELIKIKGDSEYRI